MLKVTPTQYDTVMDALGILHKAGVLQLRGECLSFTGNSVCLAEVIQVELPNV